MRRSLTVTVFVDLYSGLSYIHLQTSTTTYETLEARHASYRYAATHGVTLRHYHPNNVQAQQQQMIYFYIDKGHFQHGVAERHTQELQDQAGFTTFSPTQQSEGASTLHDTAGL
jgi:hypothetical protein